MVYVWFGVGHMRLINRLRVLSLSSNNGSYAASQLEELLLSIVQRRLAELQPQ